MSESLGVLTTPAAPPRTPRGVRIWAAAVNAPVSICKDARLRGGREHVDATYGVLGWDWGINFANFADLVNQLKTSRPPAHVCGKESGDCDPLPDHSIGGLAINAHGASGRVDVDCKSARGGLAFQPQQGVQYLEENTLNSYRAQFQDLDRLLAPDGFLYFMCCLTGQLQAGSDFLKAVSRLLPDRAIVAIATMGFSHGSKQLRPGEGCNEPGMRDTAEVWPANTQAQEDARYLTAPVPGGVAPWDDLRVLPWAMLASAHAKICRNGVIGGPGGNM
jgi:hypothetical protein